MNSAPQVHTAEIADAELDNIAGGLNPQVGITAGATSISSADALATVDALGNQAVGAATGAVAGATAINQAGVNVSL
ncbi:hypothetical protein [Streptomyces sp. V3I7]|uniref:hypothetical protein n=1 Tax=Streptomyces sp. V3I7 TaxID=3042278 RepID=UPI00278957D1|nr:hypothetical protein [Streptomyces sp. V3I7]MDQ0993036.1 hypothetical protein [Streptomyces sp. V3I7]